MPWTKVRFEREMKKFDQMLRIRRSLVEPSAWLIERKCSHGSACLLTPKDSLNKDAYVCAKDGYTPVIKVPNGLLDQHVFLELRAHDMWQHRGSGYYADLLEAQEAADQRKLEAQERSVLEECSSEVWDRASASKGSGEFGVPREAGFRSKCGGYEPGL
ncbi:hypothetical protein [Caudoviricetes sp.]|nr:hypothetical protein [Caudoviricetes sp.]